jgi:endonuclease/exonuclease/phosphatase family metal-dependent hydrolase
VRQKSRRLVPFVALLATLSACTVAHNYTDPTGPRFARSVTVSDTSHSLRVVTFNLEFGKRVPEAIRLFRQDSALNTADVVVMQEMNEHAVHEIADSLNMGYVYYPATLHPTSNRDFGNAILSRWPIEDDRKLVLPRIARMKKTQRIAVSGTIQVAGEPVRVFAVHLATLFDNGWSGQREQVRAIITEASQYQRVIIAGDMNGYGVAGREFERAGYTWATRRIPPTMHFFRVDHVFLRGMTLAKQNEVGVVRNNNGASDHKPVWAVVSAARAASVGTPVLAGQ